MVQSVVLDHATIEKVERFGALLRKSNIAYESLIVFGSQAKGTGKPWSDIDVCVVSRLFGSDRHTERVLLMNALDSALVDIEPHPYSASDLENPWDPLAKEICTWGIRVV